jgi:hypothetical protein
MRWLMLLALTVVTATVTAVVTNYLCERHYLELGRNDGSIDARAAVILKMDALLPGARTCSESEYKEWKEIVAVKSGAIYVSPVDGTTVLVCIAR